jgi:ferrochelatase
LKKGVLLVNLGTPESTKTSDVRKYLRQFLMDGRVIDIPALPRWMLVNLIIAPFRAPKSAKVYREVWTKNGSPLKYYTLELEKLLQQELGDEYLVKVAMRYQTPSIAKVLDTMLKTPLEEIIVIPLFPQYASATTGSVIEEVMRCCATYQTIPALRFIDSFFHRADFIEAFARKAKNYLAEHKYDHVLFSYHGLPERQIRKGDCFGVCQLGECCNTLTPKNRLCYRAQCFATSRLIAEAVGLAESDYTTCFQSRLGKDPWIKPYTEDIIKLLPKKALYNVLVLSPSFVADCLETTIEIGDEYKEVFEKAGGRHWQLVDSLNIDADWVQCLSALVKDNEIKAVQEQSK